MKVLKADGEDVTGAEVTIQTSAGRRRIDILVRGKDGSLKGVEVKTGKSPYTPRQREIDKVLETQGGTPVGENAKRAGLTPGTPVKIHTEVRRR